MASNIKKDEDKKAIETKQAKERAKQIEKIWKIEILQSLLDGFMLMRIINYFRYSNRNHFVGYCYCPLE
jgi:hypothetical protein